MRTMIVEQRDYRIHTGKLMEVLRSYEMEGIGIRRGVGVAADASKPADITAMVDHPLSRSG